MILLDSNVLVYSVDSGSLRHEPSHAVVARAMARELDAIIVPQVLIEF